MVDPVVREYAARKKVQDKRSNVATATLVSRSAAGLPVVCIVPDERQKSAAWSSGSVRFNRRRDTLHRSTAAHFVRRRHSGGRTGFPSSPTIQSEHSCGKTSGASSFVQNPNASLMGKDGAPMRVKPWTRRPRQAVDSASGLSVCGYAAWAVWTAILCRGTRQPRGRPWSSVAGFTPLRTDTADKRTGGIARLSHLYGWLPRLGAFIGSEDRIPVDFDDILASIAPRKTLVVAPTLDRYATHSDVVSAVAYANEAYRITGAEKGIDLQTPMDENRLTDAMQEAVIEWLLRQASN